MNLAVLRSRALTGIAAPPVRVATHLANGLPAFTIVGLADTGVRESRERLRAAILNSGYEFPNRRLPSTWRRPTCPRSRAASTWRSHWASWPPAARFRPRHSTTMNMPPSCRCPAGNGAEAALIEDLALHAVATLRQACNHLGPLPDARLPRAVPALLPAPVDGGPDMRDVRGQVQARRAIEVAAAGQHSALLVGPPGTGKSMLAQRLPGLLPPMSLQEALESAAVMSLTPGGFRAELWAQRPCRAPHHTASGPAMVGGGGNPRPAEISLAHHGVLFLDEFTEFDRRVLEVLREPLESGRITIARAAGHADFPACFQFIAAMNPCPCGYLGHPDRPCRCTPEQIRRYQSRISGPMLDRIDLQVEVPAQDQGEMLDGPPGEPSATVRARVLAARERQLARQGKPNSELGGKEIEMHRTMESQARALLRGAMTRMAWSARSYYRVLKLARTIADLEGADVLTVAHVGEAIQYRRALRMAGG